jgi:hypothetical protein
MRQHAFLRASAGNESEEKRKTVERADGVEAVHSALDTDARRATGNVNVEVSQNNCSDFEISNKEARVVSAVRYLDSWAGSDLNRWRAAESLKAQVLSVAHVVSELKDDPAVDEVRDNLRDLGRQLEEAEIGSFRMIDEETRGATTAGWVAIILSVVANVGVIVLLARILAAFLRAIIPGTEASPFDA